MPANVTEVVPTRLMRCETRAGWRVCHDPGVAREAASLLRLRYPDLLTLARLWKFLREDLHPGFHVE